MMSPWEGPEGPGPDRVSCAPARAQGPRCACRCGCSGSQAAPVASAEVRRRLQQEWTPNSNGPDRTPPELSPGAMQRGHPGTDTEATATDGAAGAARCPAGQAAGRPAESSSQEPPPPAAGGDPWWPSRHHSPHWTEPRRQWFPGMDSRQHKTTAQEGRNSGMHGRQPALSRVAAEQRAGGVLSEETEVSSLGAGSCPRPQDLPQATRRCVHTEPRQDGSGVALTVRELLGKMPHNPTTTELPTRKRPAPL